MSGLLSWVFGGNGRGVLDAANDVVRTVRGDRAAQDRQAANAHQSSLDQFGREFQRQRLGWFDSFVDGLNRLPRPFLAFGTMGLFTYAMVDPLSFTARMQGLVHVPEPLWWILGGIIGFYFGAREAHHFRQVQASSPAAVQATVDAISQINSIQDGQADPAVASVSANPALAEWREKGGGP